LQIQARIMEGQGDQNNILQEADNFINSLGNGEAPAQELPEVIAGIKREDFLKALGEASGGKLDDKSFFQVVNIREKFDQLQSQNQELTLKVNQNPFADKRIEKLNELINKGASESEVENYWTLQKVDVEKLNEVDAVRRKLLMENPDLTSEDVDSLLEETYGATDLESIEGGKKAKLKQDARAAKHFLAEMQHKSSEPESIRAQRGAQVEYEGYQKGWGSALDKLYAGKESYDIQIPLDKEGKDVLNVSQKLDEEGRKLILNATAQYAAQNKLKFTEENYKKHLVPYMENLVMLRYGKELIAQAAQNSRSTAKQETLKKTHNTFNRNEPPRNTPNQQLDSLSALKQTVFKQGKL